MKVLTTIFIIYLVQNCVTEDDLETNKKHKTYLKFLKSKPNRNIHILNTKFFKVNPLSVWNSKIKNSKYTVFPPMFQPNEKKVGVPESPFFPIEGNLDQKPRVKKVLPDYTWRVPRIKRSLENKFDNETITSVTNEKSPIITKRKFKPKNNNARRRRKHSKKSNNELRMRKGEMTTVKSKELYETKSDQLRSKKVTKISSRKRRRQRLLRKRNKHRKVEASRRLIAGRDALIEDYPYTASIQKYNEHWCAGAILNPRIVITTANCVWKSKHVSHLTVRVGSRYTDRGGQTARIQELMKHPDWNIRKNPDNDVALLLLDRFIKFSDSVHGLDLPNRIMFPAFDDAWVTSWGSIRRDGVFERKAMTLQVYHARLLTMEKCNNITERFGVTVSRNFICLSQAEKRSPCTRDTGAPAVSDGVLWGLASWGIRKLCGLERYPSMFSYIGSDSNMDFITNATHILMADERQHPFPDRFEGGRYSNFGATPSLL